MVEPMTLAEIREELDRLKAQEVESRGEIEELKGLLAEKKKEKLAKQASVLIKSSSTGKE